MIWEWLLRGALLCVVACSWNLAQQNVLGREPFARGIGLSYGVISVGAVGWLVQPVLALPALPILALGLAVNLGLVSLRLHRLYEQTDRDRPA